MKPMGFYFGADNRIRTGDLVLTKDVLYLLSHSSDNQMLIHYSKLYIFCQYNFSQKRNFFCFLIKNRFIRLYNFYRPRNFFVGGNFQKTVHLKSTYNAEAVTRQVTPSKQPYGTRVYPFSAAAFLP